MLLYEACSQRTLTGQVNALLNMCMCVCARVCMSMCVWAQQFVLWEKMNALFTINDVWISEEDKEWLAEILYYGVKCVQRCVALIDILDICEAKSSQSSLFEKGNLE